MPFLTLPGDAHRSSTYPSLILLVISLSLFNLWIGLSYVAYFSKPSSLWRKRLLRLVIAVKDCDREEAFVQSMPNPFITTPPDPTRGGH